MIGRMLNALIRRAAEGDTEAIEQLQTIEQTSAAAMTAGLLMARAEAGYSLAQLADVTGTSRQNISQRTARPAITSCGHHVCTGMRRCRQLG